MNLAGHPFALLQAASKTEQRILRHSWQRTIQTIYAFYDPRAGAPLPAIAFNLIDSFAFAKERTGPKNKNSPLPLSWFKWSDVLHASFVAGNVRSLALDFALSIDLPICRRLFRILELLRHSRKPPMGAVRVSGEMAAGAAVSTSGASVAKRAASAAMSAGRVVSSDLLAFEFSL